MMVIIINPSNLPILLRLLQGEYCYTCHMTVKIWLLVVDIRFYVSYLIQSGLPSHAVGCLGGCTRIFSIRSMYLFILVVLMEITLLSMGFIQLFFIICMHMFLNIRPIFRSTYRKGTHSNTHAGLFVSCGSLKQGYC